jgi:hypothetical protein
LTVATILPVLTVEWQKIGEYIVLEAVEGRSLQTGAAYFGASISP